VAKTYITDITLFLDNDGEIDIETGAGHRFAMYLTSIISMVSHPQPVPEEFSVKCRCRPKKIPCKGVIEGGVAPDTGVIVWFCRECSENGFISNWQGTMWDLSDADGAVH
jgi:hypothetical protein